MKFKILFIALFICGFSFGQGNENFTNIPTASSTVYIPRSWTGTDGVTWTAIEARTDQTLTGKAICTNGIGSVTSPTYAGGMGVLSFNYVRGFTGTSARSLEVWVNGVQIGTTIVVSATSNTVVNYSQTINVSGNVVLELRTSGAQIKIDDISWTGFLGCTPPSDPTGSIAVSANPSCGPATLSYSSGYYWQTTSTGTDTSLPTSSNYTLNSSGTMYVRAYDGVSCWSTNAISSGVVTINDNPVITTHPSNSSVFVGSNPSFSVVATGAGISYQWQVDTGSGFGNLSNVAPYSNVTTATLNIINATIGMNGYIYRCVVSGSSPCGNVTSNTAILTVSVFSIIGTELKPGDLVFIGYDSTAHSTCAGADDKFYIATLVDIAPGTQFLVVNSRYESGAASNVRTDRWYGSGSPVHEDPGVATFTWTDPVNSLPAGSIISFVTNSSVPAYTSIFNIRVNDVPSTLLTASGGYYPCNISSGDPDQIYIMQGVFTSFGTVNVDRYNTFAGRVLYGLTNGASWVPFTSSVSAGTTGGSTRESRLPDDIECFNIESTTLNGVRFYNNSSLRNGTKNQLLSSLINVGNWTIPSNTNCLNVTEDFTGATGSAVGGLFTITLGNPDGTWTGATDTDWFKCANWEGLSVPKSSDDVIIPVVTNKPLIGASPLKYPLGAFSNNITIDNGSSLGMPNALSRLNLYGNWTNNAGNIGFTEGLGTVYFEGLTPQIINNVTPEGTETFYNVILDNSFDTSVSNDLIASGNLTINPTKSLLIKTGDYVQASKNFVNNGSTTIEDTGILYQVDDTGVNAGNIVMQRSASIRELDYVFWSSPIDEFTVSNISTATPSDVIWKWNPRIANPNGAFGNWENCASDLMEKGKGYIVRGPSGYSNVAPATFTATFQNAIANKAKPNNGIISQRLHRGPMVAANLGTYTSANTIPFSVNDDNWNLVGNPYPSAISVNSFLTYNAVTLPVIEGSVRIWSHNALPLSSTVNPFYNSYQYNYTANDYITHNGTATISGPAGFNGYIGAGQGFFVLMNDGTQTNDVDAPINLVFNNSMRVKTTNSNSQFYKMSNSTVTAVDEKHRIWLDLVSNSGNVVRTVVGYLPNATTEKDVMYDAFVRLDGNQNFFSLIEDTKVCIQGRPVPFDNSDLVPLGVSIASSGNYTIAIAFVDGLFSDTNQNIYVEDKLLNVIHNLRTAPYNFTSVLGVFNDRFVLRYTNNALGNDEFDSLQNVVVTTQTQQITIKSEIEKITSVVVYDLLGRELVNKTKLNDNEIVLSNINAKNQALIVKIILENGKVETRKIIL